MHSKRLEQIFKWLVGAMIVGMVALIAASIWWQPPSMLLVVASGAPALGLLAGLACDVAIYSRLSKYQHIRTGQTLLCGYQYFAAISVITYTHSSSAGYSMCPECLANPELPLLELQHTEL